MKIYLFIIDFDTSGIEIRKLIWGLISLSDNEA